MNAYIKVGKQYYNGFNMNVNKITSVILSDKKVVVSSLSIRNVIGEIVDLMRFGDIEKQNITIEVEEK